MFHYNCRDVECIFKKYGTDFVQIVYHLSSAVGLVCCSAEMLDLECCFHASLYVVNESMRDYH